MIEEIGLALGILKLALEVFKDERKDRFLKQLIALEKDFQHEKDKGKDNWSDLTLSRFLRESKDLQRLVVSEASK